MIVTLFLWTKLRNVSDAETDGQTDRQICSGYYSGLHCEQCGRAVKTVQSNAAGSDWRHIQPVYWRACY